MVKRLLLFFYLIQGGDAHLLQKGHQVLVIRVAQLVAVPLPVLDG